MNSFILKSLVFISISVPCISIPALAEVSGDGTLPIPTTVTSNGNGQFSITNGTQAGSNLFHSFQEFSIPTNGSATFQSSESTLLDE